MRYTLENGKPVEVISIVVDEMRIVRPTDAQVDAAGAGHPIQTTDAPEYNPETQRLEESWTLTKDKIKQVWTVIDLPQPSETERRIAEINLLLAESNGAFETYKQTPLTYPGNGLKYKPSYITDYWTAALMMGAAAFPMQVSDADCVSREFTFAEFQTLYGWLLQESAQEIATVNAYQAPLIAELKELQNG